MSQQLVTIKKRIKSVSGAYKVTSAMKLVSTVKLRRWKDKMLNNKAYSLELTSICDEIFSFCEDIESPFIVENNKAKKDLFIVVSSTLGLCGSYNQNVFKIADKVITPNDDLIILGNKGISHFGNFSSKIDSSQISWLQQAMISQENKVRLSKMMRKYPLKQVILKIQQIQKCI